MRSELDMFIVGGRVLVDDQLYVADTYNNKIKVIDPMQGSCATFVGGTPDKPLFNEPGGISYGDGRLWVADTNDHRIRVVDLTQTLTPEFPQIALPPEMGQCWPFRIEEVSKYDERGPGWYWNNFSCGEHTGTHFDAPIHWVTGKDYPKNATDSIPVEKFVAPANVIDVSKEVAANPDFLLTPQHVEAWEKTHGRIEAGSWVLMRTDWSKRKAPAAFLNMKEDGAHVPGPHKDLVPFLAKALS